MPIRTTSISESSSFSSSLPPSLPSEPPYTAVSSLGPSAPLSVSSSLASSPVATPTVPSQENEPPVTFIEIIKDSPNLELLKEFYDGFLEVFFPISSELASWKDWIRFSTSSQTEVESHQSRIDLLVVLARQQITVGSTKKDRTIGGIVLEYYPQSNCGLISYIVVDPKIRGGGLGRKLIDQGVEVLQKQARRRLVSPFSNQYRTGCRAIFSEMNSPEKLSNDVISPTLRAQLFHKLNFALLDFRYIQPALESHLPHCDDLVLLVHLQSLSQEALVSPKIVPNLVSSKNDCVLMEKTFNPDILFEFMREVWLTLSGVNPECGKMVDEFRTELYSLPHIRLLSLVERFKASKL